MAYDDHHASGVGRRLCTAACEQWVALDRGWQATILGLCLVGVYALGQGL